MLDNDAIELTRANTSGILHKGGTILGTSRTNVYKTENGEERVLASLKERGIDVLIPIGGDDTLGVARKLFEAGFPTVGVPKTIDNDLNATDFTFGFQTAVQIATEAIDRLHSTAESHDRVIVCEVMGRDAGWIACYSGMAGGADVILVPEKPFDLDEVCDHITPPPRDDRQDVLDRRRRRGRDAGRRRRRGHRGRHRRLLRPRPPRRDRQPARERRSRRSTGYECRATVLGHIQRGGSPVAFDRVLGTRFGVAAIDAASNGDFGKMVALHGTAIELVALEDALSEPKLLDDTLFRDRPGLLRLNPSPPTAPPPCERSSSA